MSTKSGKLYLSRIGEFKLNDYRKLKGRPKSITIKFHQGKWWASVSCEIRTQDVFRSIEKVNHLPDLGADTGLSALITLSDGRVFDPPKVLSNSPVYVKTPLFKGG
jgi:putative transposase